MIIKNEKQLFSFIKYSPLIIITLIAIIINILIYIQNVQNFESDLEIYKENYILTNKKLVKFQVEKVYKNILIENKKHKEDLKNDLKQKVRQVHTIIANLHKQFKDKSKEEQLKIIKESIRKMRFNDGRGYFYIYDSKGVNVLHPIHPEYEGKSLINFKDKRGLYIVKDVMTNTKIKKEYFSSFYWSKPSSINEEYEKISFNKYYEPLDLIIGTGEYVEEYLNGLKSHILEELNENITFGRNGYIFIFDYNGLQLAHVKKSYIGKNRINLKDKNNFMIAKEIINIAKKGSGYVRYIGSIMPETGKPATKTSYVKGLQEWGWAISAGFYDKELYEYLTKKKQELKEQNEDILIKTFLVSILLIAILYIVAFYISKILVKFFKLYKFRLRSHIKESRKKDLLLHQQSKMASMGEMLGNIAHQWRQPLSTISTIASGNRLQKELDMLNDEQFYKGMDTIVATTKFLSQTIEDFRDFFNPNKVKKEFYTKDLYDKVFHLISSRIKNKDIDIISDIDNILVKGYENELIQALINIINNSVDAFYNKAILDKNIFIKIEENPSKDQLAIYIHDNAGGISDKVIDKIFDVYFTTKHKAQGTGIGLYMTYEIITKHLHGSISVGNINYNEEEKGAMFKITIPKE